MRNVTVSRKKSLVGALVPFNVYAEDHSASEIVISDVPCRKVGELKNGEELTFAVGDEETCIFAITPAIGYPEPYRIPAGDADVQVSGKCVSMASGVSFRFDGNDTDEVRELRKKRNKGAVIAILASAVLSALAVFALSMGRGSVKSCAQRSEKVFKVQELSVTLTSAFKQDKMLGFAGYIHSGDAAVFLERVGFDEAEGLDAVSAREFAAYALIGGEYGSDISIKTEGDIPYFEFAGEDPTSGEKIRTLVAFYKSGKAIWDVQFVSLEEDYPKLRGSFMKWAKTVTFDD